MKYLVLVLVGVLIGWVIFPYLPIQVDLPQPIAPVSPVTEKTQEKVEVGEDASWFTSDQGEVLFVEFPQQLNKIQSPLIVTGQAKGSWYFEASFPVVLTDWDGKIIAEGYAQAQEDWMTESYVPFEATLTFEKPAYGENGFLILQKDNPSGLSEHDDAVEIQILFY